MKRLLLLCLLLPFLPSCTTTTDPVTGKSVRTMDPALKARLMALGDKAVGIGIRIGEAKLDEALNKALKVEAGK